MWYKKGFVYACVEQKEIRQQQEQKEAEDFGCDSRKNLRQQSKKAVEILFRLVGKKNSTRKEKEPWCLF